HTRFSRDWSSDVCSSDLDIGVSQNGVRLTDSNSRSPERATLGIFQLLDRLQGGVMEHPFSHPTVGRIHGMLQIHQVVVGDGSRLTGCTHLTLRCASYHALRFARTRTDGEMLVGD